MADGFGPGAQRDAPRTGPVAPGAEVDPELDPQPFTRWVIAHPVLWGVRSGAALAVVAMANFHHVGLAAASFVVFGAFNAWCWRPGGWGIRLRRRVLRHEEQERRRHRHGRRRRRRNAMW